jgi:hypothetical protein
MSIKRYLASKDNTITDAFKPDLSTRAVTANMGSSDSLEVFSIYGQAAQGSLEKSRILIQFPIENILADRNGSKIPQSGSVKFYLKMANARHPYSLPKKFTLDIAPLLEEWDEGTGLDMETYADLGWNSVGGGNGSTWEYAKSGSQWSTQGGSFDSSSFYYTSYFDKGVEDLEVDITPLVESWASGTVQNYGLLLKLSGSQEDGTESTSYYTKKFYSSTSENFYAVPTIEARWESIIFDDRNNFYPSSSALSADDNKMNLYFFNKPRGVLKNIFNNVLPDVKFYADEEMLQEITASYKVVTNPIPGVYRAEVAINTTASTLYDKWYNTSSADIYLTSEFDIVHSYFYNNNQDSEYVINITNLKKSYTTQENIKINIFSRLKNWNPNVYTVAQTTLENKIINNLYYKIFRLDDNYTVIDYSTGSLAYSKTSYDSQGNYFDLDMSLLEPRYSYGIKLALYQNNELKEFSTVFKFRVE